MIFSAEAERLYRELEAAADPGTLRMWVKAVEYNDVLYVIADAAGCSYGEGIPVGVCGMVYRDAMTCAENVIRNVLEAIRIHRAKVAPEEVADAIRLGIPVFVG